nr:hypothetical protein [Rickettsia endosymbiont of Ixodes scapularis]
MGKYSQQEAEQIALDIAKINNTIPQNLNSKSSYYIPTKENLRSDFDKNTQILNDQATDINYRNHDIDNQSVEQVLTKEPSAIS